MTVPDKSTVNGGAEHYASTNYASALLLLALPIVGWILLAGMAAAQERRLDRPPPAPAPPVLSPSDLQGPVADGPPPAVDATTDAKRPAAEQPAAESRAGAGAVIASLTVFVLAIFVGFEIITKVPPTLHTPLMSGSNAISGITLVGALLVAGTGTGLSPVLGMVAVILASINVVGGFLVTHRMLSMFKKR